MAEPSPLRTRVITALILTGALVGVQLLALTSCLFASVFLVLLLGATALCALEFGQLIGRLGPTGGPHMGMTEKKLRGIASGAVVFLPAALTAIGVYFGLCRLQSSLSGMLAPLPFGLVIAAVGSLALMVIAGKHGIERAASALGELFVGVYLIGCGGAAFLALPFSHTGWWWWLLFVVCFNDIAAYFVGRKAGGPKLAPNLSPGKTISGAAGGLTAGIVTGVVIALAFGFGIDPLSAVLMSTACVIAAQLGDLAKSLVKRLHDSKDSGTLLPGHGGVLDRLDGILAASPVVVAYLLATH